MYLYDIYYTVTEQKQQQVANFSLFFYYHKWQGMCISILCNNSETKTLLEEQGFQTDWRKTF